MNDVHLGCLEVSVTFFIPQKIFDSFYSPPPLPSLSNTKPEFFAIS